MVLKLHNDNLPNEQAESVMESLNKVLEIQGDQYRFPKTIKTFMERSPLRAHSAVGITHYAVCPSCHHLSSPSDIPVLDQNEDPSQDVIECKRSLHQVAYKPTGSGEFCEGKVYRLNKTEKGHQLVPQLVYPYCSIISTIQKFFLRKGFAQQVSSWKAHKPANEHLFDVYDATDFLNFKARSFEPSFVSQSDYNLMLSLNIDWFSPFDTIYSVGCIYMTILNLPKQQGRDLKRNMVLVGVIPGPSEPEKTAINHYLAPMIEDLKMLLEGVTMKMVMSNGAVEYNRVRACLYSISSDLPATKKLAGSMSFNSGFGCHLCKTYFPKFEGTVNERNYCQWNCDSWVPRLAEETRRSSDDWKAATLVSQRERLEKSSGVRYSILFELPYYSYNTIAIEPMHNLYLGVAKKALKTMLPQDAYLTIKRRIQEGITFNSENSCAPMAKKIIKKGFPYVKAVEFKHFMTSVAEHVLSPPLLDASGYSLIMHLINALKLLDTNAIKRTDVEAAHDHFLSFAQGFEQRYGSDDVTPNFHFMLHLRECIYRFGPISCFWGFGFERNNLFMKSINTNHKQGFEKTYMGKMQSIIFEDDVESVEYCTD